MVASRQRPRGGRAAPFGLSLLAFLVMPTAIGSQELAALIARQPVAAERPSVHATMSPLHIIKASIISMPSPFGMAMPVAMNYVLAGLDANNADITGAIRERMLGEMVVESQLAKYPV